MKTFIQSHKAIPPLDIDECKSVKVLLSPELKSRVIESQQISCLYSEHIYKSMQKDYLYEAQVQKYRGMYEHEKKNKLMLLAEQKQWYEEKAKMIEQKNIILFALDSLTIKLTEQQQANEKNNEELKSTGQEKQPSVKFSNEEQSNKQNKTEKSQKSRTKKSIKIKTNEAESTSSQGCFSAPEKLNLIKALKKQLHINNSSAIDSIFQMNESKESDKIKNSQQFIKVKEEVNALQLKISQLQTEIEEKSKDIAVKSQQIKSLRKAKEQSEKALLNKDEVIASLSLDLKQVKKQCQLSNSNNQSLHEKVTELELQLRVTQQQFSSRQEKEKQCVKLLQKFSKQLKLNDQKIQQFLTTELSNYEQNISLECSKKTYNEHLSYILHLCKKKENLYENLVEDFKQKMKQNDFRTTLLQKKLQHYCKYQSQLMECVQRGEKLHILQELINSFKR